MNLPVEVIEAARQGRCLLFAGSRFSGEAAELAGRPWPDGRALAKALGWAPPKRLPGFLPGTTKNKKVIVPSVVQGAALFEAAQGRAALEARLRLEVGADGLNPTPAHHLALARFPLIFTTNWDDMFERAAAERGRELRVVPRGEPIPAPADGRALYRLRGGLQGEDPPLITRQDLEARAFSTPVSRQIRSLLREKVVLFVGYRPDEEEFELLWEDLTLCFGGELPRCHLAVAQGKVDDYLWQKWVWRGLLLFTADPIECLVDLERSLAT